MTSPLDSAPPKLLILADTIDAQFKSSNFLLPHGIRQEESDQLRSLSVVPASQYGPEVAALFRYVVKGLRAFDPSCKKSEIVRDLKAWAKEIEARG